MCRYLPVREGLDDQEVEIMCRYLCSQDGAVLFVSLVFLFVLTLIGLSGMQNSNLQEKMAGNMRERSLAFQAAETALKAGELLLENENHNLAFNCGGGTDGLYDISQTSAADASLSCTMASPEKDSSWTSTTDFLTVLKNNITHPFANLNDKPKYILEKLGPAMGQAGDSLEANQPQSKKLFYYRVTARGVGLSNNSVVVLQSVVRYPE